MTFFFIHKTVQCFLRSLILVKPGIKMNDQHVHFLKTLTCGKMEDFHYSLNLLCVCIMNN